MLSLGESYAMTRGSNEMPVDNIDLAMQSTYCI